MNFSCTGERGRSMRQHIHLIYLNSVVREIPSSPDSSLLEKLLSLILLKRPLFGISACHPQRRVSLAASLSTRISQVMSFCFLLPYIRISQKMHIQEIMNIHIDYSSSGWTNKRLDNFHTPRKDYFYYKNIKYHNFYFAINAWHTKFHLHMHKL